MKICTSHGGQPLTLDNFYRYSNGNHMSVCKMCHRRNVRENRELKREHYTAYLRQYNKRPERKAKLLERARSPAGKETRRIWYRFRKLTLSATR